MGGRIQKIENILKIRYNLDVSWKLSRKIHAQVRDLTSRDNYEAGALDFQKIMRKLKIREVILAEFSSDSVSGLLRKDGDEWTIYVNETDSVRRRRFTIAHEVGHLISYLNASLSKAEIDNNKGKIADFAFAARTGEINSVEAEANAIAAKLLMPDQDVISQHGEGKTVEEMAEHFQVSETAMSVRLRDLDIIPFELYHANT